MPGYLATGIASTAPTANLATGTASVAPTQSLYTGTAVAAVAGHGSATGLTISFAAQAQADARVQFLTGTGDETTAVSAASVSSITVNRPANTVDGDLLFAQVGWQTALGATGSVFTAPSGWILASSAPTATQARPTLVYCKIISSVASEPASYTWSYNNATTGRAYAKINRVLNADKVTPVNASGAQESGTKTASPYVVASVTSTRPGIILASLHVTSTSAQLPVTVTPAPGWNPVGSQLITGPTSGSEDTLVTFEHAQNTPGASGSPSFPFTPTTQSAIDGVLVAVTRGSHGTGAGTFNFGSSASGHRTPHGTASRVFSFSSVATGHRAPHGSAARPFNFAAAATGHRFLHGSAARPFNFAVAATGHRTPHGTTVGRTFNFRSQAAGHRAPHSSASTLTFRFTGAAAGHKVEHGTATNLTLREAVSAAGHAPAVTLKHGSAVRTFSFAAQTAGHRLTHGVAAGLTFRFASQATGHRFLHGSVSRPFNFAVAATGHRTTHGAVSRTFSFVSAATGHRYLHGSANSGTFRFMAATAGHTVHRGLVYSQFGFLSTSTSHRTSRGAASTGFSEHSVSTGHSLHHSAGSSASVWHAIALGHAQSRGLAGRTVIWHVSASSAGARHGEVAVQWSFAVRSAAHAVHQGATTGFLAFGGHAWGDTTKGGTSRTSAFNIRVLATGHAPVVGQKRGFATGTIAAQAHAAGHIGLHSTGSGTFVWNATTTGHRMQQGSGTGSFRFSVSAAGHDNRRGQTYGTWTTQIVASGHALHHGTRVSSIIWSIMAYGEDRHSGYASITFGVLRQALGHMRSPNMKYGTGAAALRWLAAAQGTEPSERGDGWVKDSDLWELSGGDPMRYTLLLKERGLIGPSQQWKPRRVVRRPIQHPM